MRTEYFAFPFGGLHGSAWLASLAGGEDGPNNLVVAGAATQVAGQPQLVAEDFHEALPGLAEELGLGAVDFRLDVDLPNHLTPPSPAPTPTAAPAGSARRPGAGGSRRRRACR